MNLSEYLDKSKILSSEVDRLAYARDASIYRLLPDLVVRPKDEKDIQQLFKYATENQKSITFRASGTSLSGQTVSEGIVAEIAYDWQRIEVKNKGKAIVLEPGVIGEHANQKLIKYQRRIGPDPASLKAARIGGIVANNASGMTTGKPCNSYNTMKNCRFILSNGNIYDTSNEQDYNRFQKDEQNLASELAVIRKNILNNDSLRNKIIEKYRLKNTIGYSLNSFIDFEHPLDIFAHLLVGSEGTLAFMSNIELETVPDPPFKSTALILFPSIKIACEAINPIKDIGISALELMDYASLNTAKYIDDPPYQINSLVNGSAALLCEFQVEDQNSLVELEEKLIDKLISTGGTLVGKFERDEKNQLKLWKIRKSLFTTVGALRKPGTSVITEDICFDIENLGEVITELHRIFAKWKYEDAVIFGHAKDGNLHFNLSIDLESKKGITNYHKMMDEVVEMTLDKYNGSLKAEHGTGRNMAPFVEREWGSELYKIMWNLKKLADPQNILNPGVILNKNNKIHVENIKPMPAVNDKIDLCVECGFCEPVCPSRGFTFTPRQRIGVSREIKLVEKNNSHTLKQSMRDYYFNTELTCAVDGMCETVCPVNINTGEFVKDLRSEQIGSVGKNVARWLSNHFKLTTISLRFAIKIMGLNTKIFGSKLLKGISNWFNKISNRAIPVWDTRIIGSSKILPKIEIGSGDKFIYFSSCISRVFSPDGDNQSIVNIIGQIANLSNVKLVIPDKIEDTCCSTPFSSKGFHDTGLNMFAKTIDMLYDASKEGKIPIIVDTSPCTYKFLNPSDEISIETKMKWQKLDFIDIIPFLNKVVKLSNYNPLNREILLHPTCSTQKMEYADKMIALAKQCATEVIIPDNSGCCGYAGDRGMIVPELTKNAVRFNKNQLTSEQKNLQGYSSSRMCEIGMSDKDQTYVSIALLVRDYLMQ